MIQAIIGLGNPGAKYNLTRHNIGRRTAQRLVDRAPSDTGWKSKFHGSWIQIQPPPITLRVLLPDTYMNKVGESVRPFCDFFSLEPEDIMIIHDDLELPFGVVQLRSGGGLAGHNGLKSIKQHLGTDKFHRLRIGIGRPTRGDVSSYVLSRFSPQEEAELEDVVDKSVEIIWKNRG